MRQTRKSATATAALIALCMAPYATSANITLLGLFSAPPAQANAIPVAAAAKLALSQNLPMQKASFEPFSGAPLDPPALWQFSVAVIPGNTDRSASGGTVPPRSAGFSLRDGAPLIGPVASHPLPPIRPRASITMTTDRIVFETPALAPMAFVRFCQRYPNECKPHRMMFRPHLTELSQARMAQLVQVNRDVNRAIRPQENLKGVTGEEWLLSPREGDCNDYAVTKRHKLLELGWPASALLLTEAVVPSGEHHLVLIVRTKEEDVVLDSLNWNVRPLSQVSYAWVRAQKQGNPRFWSTVSVAHAARVAMNAH